MVQRGQDQLRPAAYQEQTTKASRPGSSFDDKHVKKVPEFEVHWTDIAAGHIVIWLRRTSSAYL